MECCPLVKQPRTESCSDMDTSVQCAWVACLTGMRESAFAVAVIQDIIGWSIAAGAQRHGSHADADADGSGPYRPMLTDTGRVKC
jgi:hypothetical protein